MTNLPAVVGGFVDELRRAGLPISLSERLDTLNALCLVGLDERSSVHAALSLCLVKSADHQRVFDLLFELFFSSRQIGSDGSPGHLHPLEDGARSVSPLSAVDTSRLAELTKEVLAGYSPLLTSLVAAELVERFAGLDPTRPVAGTYYVYKAMAGIDFNVMRSEAAAELHASSRPTSGSVFSQFAEHSAVEARIDLLRKAVESEIRARLVASRGAAAVSKSAGLTVTENITIGNASHEQLNQIMIALEPLAHGLGSVLARKHQLRSRRALDFRATARASLAFGGVPIDLKLRRRRPPKPSIVVLADISGSMASYAEFTLRLVHAIRHQFSKVQCFAFRDGIADVTSLLASRQPGESLVSLIAEESDTTWLDGHSDYGHVLSEFWTRWGGELGGRSVVIIVGDARNNYHATNAHLLRLVHQRARLVYWLNPERTASWSSGDSVIGEYKDYCDAVAECRTIAQLREFIVRLL